MKRYVDGFVLPILQSKVADYEALAKTASKIWRDHGALDYWECVADDMETECSRTFLDIIDANNDETVIFAWVVFASREARDAANNKIMADPRMKELMEQLTNPETPIVDSTRMAHGGFNELVHN